MALTGVRPGEALGLQAGDVNFTAESLLVERTVDKGGRLRPPKDGERRTVDLHPRLMPVLRRLVAQARESALQQGRTWDPGHFLFATRSGQPVDLANVAKAFKRALQAASPGLTVRQTLSRRSPTHLRDHVAHQGCAINYVAAQLGHATPATTLRYYAHWLPRVGVRHVDRLLDTPAPAPAGAASGMATP